ncbi:MAG: CbtA family protein [Acidimicrobiales bacterium]|nr:CbtA family protein [Acidimicrobiales bacterium]
MDHIKAFLWRGALAGVIAGGVASLFQLTVTEREIRAALAFEEVPLHDHGAHHAAEEMFSRSTQVVGGMLAVVLYGLCLGVVFAFALALVARRIDGATWFARAIKLAALLFVGWVLIPQLKYPANPPAVGDPETVGQRTASYGALLVIGLVVVFGALWLWHWASERGLEEITRFVVVAGVAIAAVGVAYVVLPAAPDQNALPADLIWRFRVESLATNAILWIGIATGFGWLARGRADRQVDAPVDITAPISSIT